ncbi:hypothetical protein B0T25DRAFT_315338 [Lasiosphaeria hispida]|uniref:Shugoshin n=1 Tax=Lasiosphaeria hispida TaxID=260671 RepID=A0AAJ0H9J2_9PEZI|nr:hypothetical protein B0T25DRAFT_315338 [Lasiosphaeria hispida]
MARLNEPPVLAESNFDILRRKFLRQNRDLARVNSNQSNRIRTLENECARLLSENLDLRGQVMRLEKELENNQAQRIADHAVEIRAKMEAQLAELGSMLASLGTEPPSKRHSSEGRRIAKARSSNSRSPAQKKLRDTSVDPEALAAQEGRLPPIQENKQYPRATMNSEEIMALCAEAADTSTSPEIGPPPISRFVEEELAKPGSPTRKVEKAELRGDVRESRKQPETPAPVPKLDYQRKQPNAVDPKKEPESIGTQGVKPDPEADQIKPAASTPIVSTLKAGAKRKYGDENEGVKNVRAQPAKENSTIGGTPKLAPLRDLQKRRSIKDLAANRREKAASARTPLSLKSANEDFSSPKKATKAQALDDTTIMKPEVQPQPIKDPLAKERPSAPRPPLLPRVEIPIPDPPPTTTTIFPEPEPGTPAPLISPNTPSHSTARETTRDTPPPAHISATGETQRAPGRRARAAISYAEPNLRDKMRRPTKELFDAVAGEGKKHFSHRSSTAALPREDGTSGDEWKTAPAPVASAGEDATRRESVLSPLAQREVGTVEELPFTVITERKKQPSTVGRREPMAAIDGGDRLNREREPAKPRKEKNAPVAEVAADIYDFAASPPHSEMKGETEPQADNDVVAPKPKRNVRRASAAQPVRDNGATTAMLEEETPAPSKSRASSSGRKRASMLAPKKTAMADLLDGDYYEDQGSTVADEAVSTLAKDKISRRRSMVL